MHPFMSAGHLSVSNCVTPVIEPENEGSERVAVKVGMHLEKEVVRPSGEVRRVYAIEAEAENQVIPPEVLT